MILILLIAQKKQTGTLRIPNNLYIDGTHAPKGSGVELYQFNDHYKNFMDPTTSWDPAIRNHNWDILAYKTRRSGTTTYYECKLQLNEAITAGKAIGIDHVFIDKDQEDKLQSSLSGKIESKINNQKGLHVYYFSMQGEYHVMLLVINFAKPNKPIFSILDQGYIDQGTSSRNIPFSKLDETFLILAKALWGNKNQHAKNILLFLLCVTD